MLCSIGYVCVCSCIYIQFLYDHEHVQVCVRLNFGSRLKIELSKQLTLVYNAIYLHAIAMAGTLKRPVQC